MLASYSSDLNYNEQLSVSHSLCKFLIDTSTELLKLQLQDCSLLNSCSLMPVDCSKLHLCPSLNSEESTSPESSSAYIVNL